MARHALVVSLALLLGLSGAAFAGPTQEITVTVTVEYISVSLTGDLTLDLGQIVAGESKLSSAIVVQNDGTTAENISLRITDEDDRDVWTRGDAPAENVYVLSSILVNDGEDDPVAGDYGANDILATAAKYWKNDTGAAAGSELVANVADATAFAPDAIRNLMFLYTAPTRVSGATRTLSHTATLELAVEKD